MLIETDLTADEIGEVQTAIDYAIQKFEGYRDYPSYEFKRQRVAEMKAIRAKVREIKRQLMEHDENKTS